MTGPRHPCAGGIVLHRGRLLLVLRGHAPSAGTWSIPGGRCLPGEAPEVACVRELAEETGLRVRVTRFAGRVLRDAPDGGIYVIDDFVCEPDGTGGAVGGGAAGGDTAGDAGAACAVRAGDDAADARWFSRAELDTVPLAPGVLAALTEWGLLPD